MKVRRIIAAGLLLALLAQSKLALAQRVLGLDVSAWQGNISQSTWDNIYNIDNRQFVFIRSSRGGTTGYYNQSDPTNSSGLNTLSQRYDDPYFVQNINRATTAGLFAGSYHFARPDVIASTQNSGGIPNNGADEANHHIQMAGAWMRPGYLVPVFDLESGQTLRTNSELAQFSLDFSNRIYEVMGIRPAIYVNGNYSNVLQQATLSQRDQLAQPPVSQPSVVSPAFPTLWNARWPASPNVQNDNPKDTASTFYGPWDDYGSAHPWNFWQYTSSGSVSGISPVDLNVSHGDIEYLKDSLVPAVWMNDISGDWGTLLSWNSGQPAIAPVTGPDQVPPVAIGPLPTPRLPGAAGAGITDGHNDTVILERPNADITVTISSGTHNIRKLYMRETLEITGGSLTINYDPTYNFNVGNPAALRSGPISAQFSGPVTLSGSGSLSVHTLQVDATHTFTVNGGTPTFNRINLMPHGSNPATMALNMDLDVAPSPDGTVTIASGPGAGLPGRIDLGGATRTLNVGDGAPDVDFAIHASIVNGGLIKTGAGTLGLSGETSGDVTVSAGKLAPGASIGALSTTNLSFHPTTGFAYEWNPSLLTADLVNVANGLSIANDVSLDLSALNPAQVPRGTKFTLISYGDTWDGGAFAGYPQNSSFTFGDNKFRIRYNDTPSGAVNGGAHAHAITLTALNGALQTTINGFVGYYDPANWTTEDTVAHGGFIDTSGAPESITIFGPDDGSGSFGQIGFSIQVPAGGTFSFDWSYSSTDPDPGWDFAYYINNSEFFLSTFSGEFGQVSVPVNAGDLIGWRVKSTDSIFGAGVLTISNFSAPGPAAPVPEPASLLLAALATGLISATRRRRR